MTKTQVECPECASIRTERSKLGGAFRTCHDCGKLFAVESDAAGLTPVGDGDGTEEIILGWRAWNVQTDSTKPRLWSVTHSATYWVPGEPMVATCGDDSHCPKSKDGSVPGEECQCGLYSAKNRKHLTGMGYHRYDADAGTFSVMGTVRLWGKVIEGSQGWRAECGYPHELFVPFEAWRFAKSLGETYGVPVKLNNILAQG